MLTQIHEVEFMSKTTTDVLLSSPTTVELEYGLSHPNVVMVDVVVDVISVVLRNCVVVVVYVLLLLFPT